MAISHADHDHPNTPAGRAACRKANRDQVITDAVARHTTPERRLAEQAGLVKPAQMTVVPRRRGDGGVVKGMQAVRPSTTSKAAADRAMRKAEKGGLAGLVPTTKKPNTQIKNIGDLADVPRMLAYGVRMAWAKEWSVRVGDKFNDNEARIVIDAPAGEIALVYRPSLPNGVWGVFFRAGYGSVTTRVESVQLAFELGELNSDQ